MSNENDLQSEDLVIWRKRIPLRARTLSQLEAEAQNTVRTPEGMAAFIIEEYFRGGGKAGKNE